MYTSKNTKPNFLGIGVPRSGTTWVYKMISKHKKIYVPKEKEIHFFDHKYKRGNNYYENFFRKAKKKHTRIGEFTPHYLFRPGVDERVKEYGGIEKFIVVLRNPLDRTVSHYRWRIQRDGYAGSFEEFVGEYPESIVWSLYAKPLRKWFRTLGKEKFLILIHEEMFEEVGKTRKKIAHFLRVDPDKFADQAGEERVNASVVPKARGLYGALKSGAEWMRRNGADEAIDALNEMGVTNKLFAKIFGTTSAHQACALDQRRNVGRHFIQEVSCLEHLLGRSLPWEFDA